MIQRLKRSRTFVGPSRNLYARSEHVDIENSSVHLHTLNASSIDVLLLIYMDANTYDDELDIREQLDF